MALAVDMGDGNLCPSLLWAGSAFTTFSAFPNLDDAPRVSSPSQLPVESNQTQTHFIFLDKGNAVLVGGRDWNLRSSLCLECLSFYLKNHSILVNGERESNCQPLVRFEPIVALGILLPHIERFQSLWKLLASHRKAVFFYFIY